MTKIYTHRGFKITRSHKKKDKYNTKKPPVRKGQIVDIYINDLSDKGDGVGKIEKFTIFVPRAQPGEFVRVEITEVMKSCAVGKRVKQKPVLTKKLKLDKK
ncbi:MAG: TRAM domain-containing protein [Candidatus Aenigmarchaeota archaeon]|nr:TRAM domain-containing protein [Candidatus Aenigmarchaeota archaeon]